MGGAVTISEGWGLGICMIWKRWEFIEWRAASERSAIGTECPRFRVWRIALLLPTTELK